MRNRPRMFRLSAALAIVGTTAAALSPVTGQAQPPPIATAGDPPARVGRVSLLSGTVSFHTGDQQQWSPATLNYPVTSANSFWTEPGAKAQIDIGASHLALDQQTELDIETLDATQLTATEPQGATYLRVGVVNPGETTTIRTPRGTVSITAPGRYAVAAGDTEKPTTVTVIEGAAQVAGDNLSLSVGPHQTATITGADQFQGSVGSQVDDPFVSAQLAAENPPALVQAPQRPAYLPAASRPVVYQPPPVVQQMTGSGDLQSTGAWVETPQYGHVWYPPVETGWVPYRHGHWSYVAPWGWTWVDDAPWGFAPYHYGRWVDVGDRWGWVPVAPEAPIEVAPVYSPALVDFVGIAAGVAVGAAIGIGVGLALGGGGGNVCWVPLGYREPYIPPYGGSPGYVNRINSPNFNRNTNIGTLVDQRRSFVNNGTINRSTTTINNYYGNAAGATVAPASVLQTSQPVAAVARPVTAQQFAQIAQPHVSIPRPTGQTSGITPAVARQQNIPLTQIAQRPPAPGPVLQAHGPAPNGPGSAPARTGLPAGALAVGGAAAVGLAGAGVAGALAGRPGQTPAPAPQSVGAAPHPGLPPLAPIRTPAVAAPSRPPVATPPVAVARQGAPGPAIVAHPAPGLAAASPRLVPHVPPAVPAAAPAGGHSAPAAPALPHPGALPPVQTPAASPHAAASSAAAAVPTPHIAAPQSPATPHPTAPTPVAPHVAAPARPAAPVVQAQHPTAPPRPTPPRPAPPRPMPPAIQSPRPMPAAIQAPRPVPMQPHPAPMPRPAPHKTCPPGRAAC